jgi:hypothetical protein
METYGVSFDGFEPSCGWPMYKHIEEDLIPHLKREVVRWRERRDAATNEWSALKGLKGDVEGMMKSRGGLVARLQAKIFGSEATVNDVMPLGLKDAGVETSNSWQELASWLDEASQPLEQIALFYKHACERATFNHNLLEKCLESTEIDIRFWERTLELQRAYWVFEKVALKYKTKICRELVKALDGYIGDCREQLGRYKGKDSSASALYEDIEWLFNEAEADLAYYRQIKTDIAEVGIEEALRHSSRKVIPPTSDMP